MTLEDLQKEYVSRILSISLSKSFSNLLKFISIVVDVVEG